MYIITNPNPGPKSLIIKRMFKSRPSNDVLFDKMWFTNITLWRFAHNWTFQLELKSIINPKSWIPEVIKYIFLRFFPPKSSDSSLII